MAVRAVTVAQILLLGRNINKEEDRDLQPLVDSGHVTIQPPGKPWKEFLLTLQRARALFVPNVHDASPRQAFIILNRTCGGLEVACKLYVKRKSTQVRKSPPLSAACTMLILCIQVTSSLFCPKLQASEMHGHGRERHGMFQSACKVA